MPKRAPVKLLPTVEFLHACLSYDQATGELRWQHRPREHFAKARTWAIWNARFAGKIAGSVETERGYYLVCLDGVQFKAHRVIWKMMTGEEPPETIDHWDTDPLNNRWGNLRVATHREQRWNTGMLKRGGRRGVSPTPSGRFQAHIRIDGVLRYLGTFGTIDEASAVYEAAARALHGEWFHDEAR